MTLLINFTSPSTLFFNFELGNDFKDNSNEKLYKNTRGFLVKGDVGNKFSFESSFYETRQHL